MNNKSTTTDEGDGSSSQNKEMQIWSLPNRLPRNGSISWTNKNGPNRIKQWPTPKTMKDVRSFMGFTNLYRKFIGNYSNIARPLIDLT